MYENECSGVYLVDLQRSMYWKWRSKQQKYRGIYNKVDENIMEVEEYIMKVEEYIMEEQRNIHWIYRYQCGGSRGV